MDDEWPQHCEFSIPSYLHYKRDYQLNIILSVIAICLTMLSWIASIVGFTIETFIRQSKQALMLA